MGHSCWKKRIEMMRVETQVLFSQLLASLQDVAWKPVGEVDARVEVCGLVFLGTVDVVCI
jgi:hypothetical protein